MSEEFENTLNLEEKKTIEKISNIKFNTYIDDEFRKPGSSNGFFDVKYIEERLNKYVIDEFLLEDGLDDSIFDTNKSNITKIITKIEPKIVNKLNIKPIGVENKEITCNFNKEVFVVVENKEIVCDFSDIKKVREDYLRVLMEARKNHPDSWTGAADKIMDGFEKGRAKK